MSFAFFVVKKPMPPATDFHFYLITDRRQVPAGRSLLQQVEAALIGGVRAVQLREKDLSAAELLPLARELRDLTRAHSARLLINDRIDVALAVDADGVHLGGHSLPTSTARRLLGPERLIGVSTHHLDEITAATEAGADFVTFGPIFATPSKAAYGPPLGLEALRTACGNAPLPVFALGGISADKLPQLRAAGCRHCAAIGAVLAAADATLAARAFANL